jgi:hypothetical protein
MNKILLSIKFSCFLAMAHTITFAQNVGVGTTNPAAKLEVANVDTAELKISSFNGFGPARVSFISDKNLPNEWRPGFIESADAGGFGGRLDFYTNGFGLTNKFGRARAMSILNENVGIGTTTPTSKLNVNGQITIDQKNFGGFGGLLIKGNTPGNNYPNLGFSISNTANADVFGAAIQGELANNSVGNESINLGFYTTNAGFGSLSQKMVIMGNGNIGIGGTPLYKLHLGNAANGLRIEGPATAGTGASSLSVSSTGDILVDKPGIVGGRFTIKENGNVGIGEFNTGFPLNFASTLGDKISLYGNGGNHYGLGVQGGTLQIHAATAADDIAFGTGRSEAFNEKFRFKGNGAMAIGGNTGSAGQVLTSSGVGAPTWVSPISSSGPYVFGRLSGLPTTETILNGTPITINYSYPVKVMLFYTTGSKISSICGIGNCPSQWILKAYVDNFLLNTYDIDQIRYASDPSPDNVFKRNSMSGPDLLVLSPGPHTISFTGMKVFALNDLQVTLDVHMMIMP